MGNTSPRSGALFSLAGQAWMAVPPDGDQPQTRCHPSFREHFQSCPLILQQSFRHAQKYADHALPAPWSADRALIAVDHHRLVPAGCAVSHIGLLRRGTTSCVGSGEP